MADIADNVFRQKAVIEFLTKEGIAAKNISDRLNVVYGESSLSFRSVKRWVAYFKDGNTTICDKMRSGRPPSAATAGNKATVDELIRSDRRVSCRIIADSVGISIGTAHTIVAELGYSKVCARWVPRQLTDELKLNRFNICTDLLQRYASEGCAFMNRIVTGDESWAHHYEPETKRQSMQWHHIGSPTPKKFKLAPSAGKVMITVFWDVQGVLLIDFLPKGETINSVRYQETLKKLAVAIRRKRPTLQNVILHHDNARPHTAHATSDEIAAKGWTVLPHPPYSPDLAPSDFFLFGPLKDFLRGQRFNSDDEVKAAVRSWFRQCEPTFFSNGFIQWKNRWDKCVARRGDYIEK
jgi:[histone H3]-lysine36 N-dimethyltransferase SETMAR